jgi:hypothetical protein
VSENMLLRFMFGSKREEVTGVWRKLYDELSDIYLTKYGGHQIKED